MTFDIEVSLKWLSYRPVLTGVRAKTNAPRLLQNRSPDWESRCLGDRSCDLIYSSVHDIKMTMIQSSVITI